MACVCVSDISVLWTSSESCFFLATLVKQDFTLSLSNASKTRFHAYLGLMYTDSLHVQYTNIYAAAAYMLQIVIEILQIGLL